MSYERDGGTAFPHPNSFETGMTLRDYFAAAVLPAVWSSAAAGATLDDMAGDAYALANAMLKARK